MVNSKLEIKFILEQSGFYLKKNGIFDMDRIKVLSKSYGLNENEFLKHIYLSFQITHIPKILAMLLNDGYGYQMKEMSVTDMEIKNDITNQEKVLYDKWLDIFRSRIRSGYGDVLEQGQIENFAIENARYLISVFMPVDMVYTTSFQNIQSIASFMNYFIREKSFLNDFELKLGDAMKQFLEQLSSLGVLDWDIIDSKKCPPVTFVGSNLDNKEELFGDVYSFHYKTSFASYGYSYQYSSIRYCLDTNPIYGYYVPSILRNCDKLDREWLCDIEKLKENYPQGKLVMVTEEGNFTDFVRKSEDIFNYSTHLELIEQEKSNLVHYMQGLERNFSSLYNKILPYYSESIQFLNDYGSLEKRRVKKKD